MTPGLRGSLIGLPEKLGCKEPRAPGDPSVGPGGVQRPGNNPNGGVVFTPTKQNNQKNDAKQQQRMPDIVRIVTNYVDGPARQSANQGKQQERDQEGNDVQQDIHLLLVLLDSLRQADYQVTQRVSGIRQMPLPETSEAGCPIL